MKKDEAFRTIMEIGNQRKLINEQAMSNILGEPDLINVVGELLCGGFRANLINAALSKALISYLKLNNLPSYFLEPAYYALRLKLATKYKLDKIQDNLIESDLRSAEIIIDPQIFNDIKEWTQGWVPGIILGGQFYLDSFFSHPKCPFQVIVNGGLTKKLCFEKENNLKSVVALFPISGINIYDGHSSYGKNQPKPNEIIKIIEKKFAKFDFKFSVRLATIPEILFLAYERHLMNEHGWDKFGVNYYNVIHFYPHHLNNYSNLHYNPNPNRQIVHVNYSLTDYNQFHSPTVVPLIVLWEEK